MKGFNRAISALIRRRIIIRKRKIMTFIRYAFLAMTILLFACNASYIQAEAETRMTFSIKGGP